ncbi:hypothetical protein [Litchfieldella xinjiangensis]|uniref:hypothetical protein n=1 Tax=Litchfieldella xinjiangensis TaxID=1166948 RepID=UPI0005B85580|nr:hypothetical protein [Halomonas xinjiangensis]
MAMGLVVCFACLFILLVALYRIDRRLADLEHSARYSNREPLASTTQTLPLFQNASIGDVATS